MLSTNKMPQRPPLSTLPRTLLRSCLRVILTTSPVAVSRIANGCSRARSSSASVTVVNVVNIVNVAAISRRHSAEDLDGGGSDGGEGDTQGTARTADAQCKRLDMISVPEMAPSCLQGIRNALSGTLCG